MRFNWLLIPVLVMAAALFVLGVVLERRRVPGAVWAALLAALPGLVFVVFYLHLFDQAAWFYHFRALPYTELTAAGVGLLAGYVYSWFEPDTAGQRAAFFSIVLLLLGVPYLKPILVPLDLATLQDRWNGDVCLQSTLSTCGPASAATILRRLGLHVTERELARECFTYRGGTENWYLIRALRRRGLSARATVRGSSDPVPAPAIAGVVLRGSAITSGAGHFIAILERSGSRITIADPLRGLEILDVAALARRYKLTGFFLEISRPTY